MLVERDHIGFFGKMNSGKSSLMNLLTQQETSIADATPGTTADTKIAMQEIHGLGPVKLYDTAGLDELSGLGSKKRNKVLNALKECDLVLLVIDPSTRQFETEALVLNEAREADKQIMVIFNLFSQSDEKSIERIKEKMPVLERIQSIVVSAVEPSDRSRLLQFILEHFDSKNQTPELLPFVEANEFYVLNIPMDEETPGGRFLRPQAMAQEYITRKWAYPVAYRMNLGLARSEDNRSERQRFERFLSSFSQRPKAIITDSQAMDMMAAWAPEDIVLTTFSIMMINYASRGRIMEFYEGIRALDHLQAGDRVLIAEACNHSRIQEDIGTVQIPAMLARRFPGVAVDFNFGREFQNNEDLQKYRLIIHCGGCMISNQKLQARLRELRTADVPVSNYGVFLSYMQGEQALERVMKPWRS